MSGPRGEHDSTFILIVGAVLCAALGFMYGAARLLVWAVSP
jgi:hypothetical protein